MRFTQGMCLAGVVTTIFIRGSLLMANPAAPLTASAFRNDQATLWTSAWHVASSAASPIDAQRAKVDLVMLAITSNQGGHLESLAVSEPEPWCRAACLSLLAADAAFNHTLSVAATHMREAQRLSAMLNEWHGVLAHKSLLIGQAALVLLTDTTHIPDVDSLNIWVNEEDSAARTLAASWVCAEWTARQATNAKTDNASLAAVIRASWAYAAADLPWERLARLRRTAHGLARCNLVETGVEAIEAILGQGGAEALSADRFGMITDAAIAYDALGLQDRANALGQLAESRAARGAFGDTKTPWVLLAEVRQAAGQPAEQVRAAWQQAWRHAHTQPGYFKEIALARTLGNAAVAGVFEITRWPAAEATEPATPTTISP